MTPEMIESDKNKTLAFVCIVREPPLHISHLVLLPTPSLLLSLTMAFILPLLLSLSSVYIALPLPSSLSLVTVYKLRRGGGVSERERARKAARGCAYKQRTKQRGRRELLALALCSSAPLLSLC